MEKSPSKRKIYGDFSADHFLSLQLDAHKLETHDEVAVDGKPLAGGIIEIAYTVQYQIAAIRFDQRPLKRSFRSGLFVRMCAHPAQQINRMLVWHSELFANNIERNSTHRK